jgi:predicted transcriptional regulator of viral defense system
LELQRVLGISPVAATFLLHRYTKQGELLKLRNGLYALADRPPSEWLLANRLYDPSYVSFEYALAYYHIIPETTYTITSATPRPTRTFTSANHLFEYHRLKRPAFTGYEPTRIGGDTVLIATPEKALVDYLYFVDLRKKPLTDRLSLRELRRSRLESYAALFQRPSLVRLARSLR